MRLAVSTDQADPFCCSPAWQLPFHYARNPSRRVVIDEAQDALLAFAIAAAPFALQPIESFWKFGCPMLGESAADILRAWLARVPEQGPQIRRVEISGIRPHRALSKKLKRALAGRYTCRIADTAFLCSASLASGWDGYLSRRSAHHRKNIRRELRRAGEEGVYFQRVCPTSIEEATAAYARMIDVEARSWKGLGKCGMTSPFPIRFYELMLQWLARTRDARVVFAWHEGRDIGFIFGGMAASFYRGQQFSFDHAWRHLSIGNLLQVEQVRWLCEEGAERYDLGPSRGARMEYKSSWTEQESEIQTWIIEKK